MKKKIIIILSYCIVAITFCLIGFFIGIHVKNINPENKDNQIYKVVGTYNNKNWNNREGTLILNEDFTCKYPNSSSTCEWTINSNVITITTTIYALYVNHYSSSTFNDKNTCEAAIKEVLKENESTQLICEPKYTTHNATLVDNGVILHDHHFEKVG